MPWDSPSDNIHLPFLTFIIREQSSPLTQWVLLKKLTLLHYLTSQQQLMINDAACSVASSSKEKSVPNLRWSRLNLSRVGHVFRGEQRGRRIKYPAYIHTCRKEAHPHVSREPVRSPETSHSACKWWNYISSTLSVIQGLFCSMNPWNDVNSESISQGATLKGNIQVIYNSSPQAPGRGPVLLRGSFDTGPYRKNE